MLIDTLIKWNRWGRNLLASGYPRQLVTKIIPFLETTETIALIGMRRSGKSTILYQLMDLLEKQGVSQKAMLHINFEEPAFAPELNLQLLDKLYDTYRSEVMPEGKAYLFLDEIQNIPGWERWVRARNETENVKIFITGSSAYLMSRELSTVLTGRHFTFEVWPLNFAEMLAIRQIEIPVVPLPKQAPALIQHQLNFLMKWGSLPKVVLAENDSQREEMLSQYFDDILLRDIAMRHSVRDLSILRSLAVHLLTNTAGLTSFQRLAKVFDVSPTLIQSYTNYLYEAYLLEPVTFFSLKTAERLRNPQKMHAVDLGIRNLVSITHSVDTGKNIESLVFQSIKFQSSQEIYYWKNQGEIDFILRSGNEVTTLIQVVSDGLDKPEVMQREIRALQECLVFFPKAKALLVIAQYPSSNYPAKEANIQTVPLWQFLLDARSFIL